MNPADSAHLEDYVNRPERASAADCSAIANEAGLRVRENRRVVPKDLDAAYKTRERRPDAFRSTPPSNV